MKSISFSLSTTFSNTSWDNNNAFRDFKQLKPSIHFIHSKNDKLTFQNNKRAHTHTQINFQFSIFLFFFHYFLSNQTQTETIIRPLDISNNLKIHFRHCKDRNLHFWKPKKKSNFPLIFLSFRPFSQQPNTNQDQKKKKKSISSSPFSFLFHYIVSNQTQTETIIMHFDT